VHVVDGALPIEQIRRRFAAQGHVRLPGFFPPEQMAEMVEHVAGLDPDQGDENPLSRGAMTFYSRLWPRSERLRSLLADPRLLEAVGAILGPDLWVRWDQAVDKGPGAGVFPWHQDNEYSKLRDEHVQVWIAMTSATAEDGGLELVPVRHRRRLPHGLDDGHVVHEGEPTAPPVPVVADAGDVVLFSSYTLHRTTPNTGGRHRWVYVAEYLRLRDTDPFLEPPYLVVARGGQPALEVTDVLPGDTVRNRLRYRGVRDKPWAER
jgi:hypothetical protein